MNDKTNTIIDRQTDRQTRRIEYIDIFRSFGIVLMVMGHIGFGEKFDHFIHAFHMPMFFFVSGFLFKSITIPFFSYIKKKAISLLLPYFVFAALHYAISFIMGDFSFKSFKGLLFPDTVQIPIAGALWFLTALFFADIIYYWISRIRNKRIQWMVVCVISIIGQIVSSKFYLTLPFAMGAAFVGVGLMHIGKMLKHYEQQITDLKIYQILFFGVLIGVSIMKTGYINMRSGWYPDALLLFWTNAVFASIIGMNIAKKIEKILGNSVVNRYFKSVGRNSIVYLCLNQIIILGSKKVINYVLNIINPSFESVIIERVLALIISLTVLLLSSILFEKTFFRVLIGKIKKS